MTRTAATLALASAASVTLLGETGHAEPRLTPAEVKSQVDSLYRQAEQATEQYNGAKEQADAAGSAVDQLQDELARKTARLNTLRDEVGSLAAAQYRGGSLDPTVQFALSGAPDAYLEQTSLLSQIGSRQTAALDQLTVQQREVTATHDAAGEKLATLRGAQTKVADRKRTVERKLHQAQALLDQLTAAQRAAVASADYGSAPADAASRAAQRTPLGTSTGSGSGTGTGTSDAAPTGSAPAASGRAAKAVAFAYRALGLPYVWGATGPNAYDCSGLTQAAWRAAGVSLPRTTYTQINAGTRVSESQLQPGDLVFFYSGISHVGLYIGNGQMIHAPHPGAPVRVAPISEMPFAGATRPA
jgi:cell wall-associated NlpC family hydrolase